GRTPDPHPAHSRDRLPLRLAQYLPRAGAALPRAPPRGPVSRAPGGDVGDVHLPARLFLLDAPNRRLSSPHPTTIRARRLPHIRARTRPPALHGLDREAYRAAMTPHVAGPIETHPDRAKEDQTSRRARRALAIAFPLALRPRLEVPVAVPGAAV